MALTLDKFYWSNNGRYQKAVDALQALIPAEGTVPQPYKNKALERFRKACNRYYRLYNDGDFGVGPAKMFGIEYPSQYRTYKTFTYPNGRMGSYKSWGQGLYDAVEPAMDEIIVAAAIEQGIQLV